ncbi:hypothetical protein ACIG0D_18645 [Streptomyces sp. NPDC052773]|jgi:hypothetical protein|uniref:hypothetical protein n=1 Tax=Streptomyces sp. NPDC052773 TaxID=3365693 RepID=UPI0037D58DD5
MLDSASWKSALLDVLGSGWTFARVGPRRHEDWRRDVVAVMTLRAEDPRRWHGFDYAPEVGEDRSGIGAPFVRWPLDQLGACLYEVRRASAEQMLVALQGELYQASRIPDFDRRRDGLFRSARQVLSRFGPRARYFTNASEARGHPDACLLDADTAWECLSVFTTDCGLVAVSDTEVGVFWAFWED